MGGAYTKNFDVLIGNIETLGTNGIKKLSVVADNIADFIKEELLKNIAVVDEHTLEELANMGHPYGYKGGESQHIETRITSRESGLPHEEPLIHSQSGKLKDAVKTIRANSYARVVMGAGVDPEQVEYIKYLVHGTSKMIARPVFSYTWQKVRVDVLKRLKTGLAKSLSSKNQSKYRAK